MGRDKTIDNLRGLAMLWVIVVHVLYWGNFFVDPNINLFKSFFLFEMPLFFFITGASNGFSKTGNYFVFVIRRFQRFLIPYWVFAVICAALSIGKYAIVDSISDPLFAVKVVISWLLPLNLQVSSVAHLTSALWFVPVYLCIVLLIPLFKYIKTTPLKNYFFFIITAVFVLTALLDCGWVQNVAFYSIWIYVGLFYKEIRSFTEKKNAKMYLLLIAVLSCAIIIVLYFNGGSIDMQFNKFPPNITFLFFSLLSMSLIFAIIPRFNTIVDILNKFTVFEKVFSVFSTRSMTVFLYQVFAFNVTIRLSNMLITGDSTALAVLKCVLCLLTTLPACAVLAFIFGKIENLEIIKFQKPRNG